MDQPITLLPAETTSSFSLDYSGEDRAMTVTEITVELKNPPQVVFSEATPSVGNYVRFRVSPQVQIAIGARAKRPAPSGSGPQADSRIDRSFARSLRFARRMAAAMKGAASLENPSGCPRLRSVISVPPPPEEDHV